MNTPRVLSTPSDFFLFGVRDFWSEDAHCFYDTAHDHERLVSRPRDVMDNAVPSGTSLASELLLLLAAHTGDDLTVRRIDGDHAGTEEKPAGLYGLYDLIPRLRLRVGRDCVFEIEDHAIDRERARLVDGAGVRSGHEEHTAARSDGHGKPPWVQP